MPVRSLSTPPHAGRKREKADRFFLKGERGGEGGRRGAVSLFDARGRRGELRRLPMRLRKGGREKGRQNSPRREGIAEICGGEGEMESLLLPRTERGTTDSFINYQETEKGGGRKEKKGGKSAASSSSLICYNLD